MNPYSLVALVLSVFLFFKGKKGILVHVHGRLLIDVPIICQCCVLCILLGFLTFSTLNQVGNVESMGGAVSASFKWYDFVYFIDTLVYLFILIFKTKWLDHKSI